MLKEFPAHIAWTDAMKEGAKFVGLIEFQRKQFGSVVQVLWVISPNCLSELDAHAAAEKMLQEICAITFNGCVIYSDGVML